VTNYQATNFPVIESVTQLWRALINDTFPGIGGAQGRIATDTAPFTMPFLNSAIQTVQRKLREEGVNFPIKDGIILENLAPVVTADPSLFVNVSFNGYNNGTTNFAVPFIPGDCLQIYKVQQRVTGSNLQFTPMTEAKEGLLSAYQNNWMGQWEARGYALWMNGSLIAQDLMIRYLSGQPPLNTPAADFENTPIYILDSTDALARLMAIQYGRARGADPTAIAGLKEEADDMIATMANEYIRRSQGVNYRRQAYGGGGSGNGGTGLGSTGVVE